MELNREMLKEEFESLLAIAKFTDNDFITSPFRKEYIEYALAFINELAEENTKLQVDFNELYEENEDLNAIAEQYRKQFEEARADTVREFAERVKDCIHPDADHSGYELRGIVDQIAKEMIGE